jgi:hypothetical protein
LRRMGWGSQKERRFAAKNEIGTTDLSLQDD